MTSPIVFLDTETTGLHPERRVWEVAMIRTDGSGHSNGCSFFVGDVDLAKAELKGLQVGRFYERHPLYNGQLNRGDLQRGWYSTTPFGGAADFRIVSEAQAARRVEDWTRGAHLVGAVPSFDAEVLAAMLRRHHLVESWHYHLIDVIPLAAGYLCGRRASFPEVRTAVPELPWASEDLSRALGVEPPGADRHTAMGDARWAKAIYESVTGGTRP